MLKINLKYEVLTLCSFILSTLLNAQGLINNGAYITISSGTYINIVGGTNGDFTNQTTGGNLGRVELDGIIQLQGDWTNNSNNVVFQNLNSTGTVQFTGNTNQDIGGSYATTFENLTINNTANNTAAITAAVRLNVSGVQVGASSTQGTLTLTDGVLDLNGRTLIIANKATTAISYVSGAGYIKASLVDKNFSNKLQWNIGNETGTHTIPYGKKDSEQLPVSFTLNSGSVGNMSFSTYYGGSNATELLANLPTTPAVANLNTSGGIDNSANVVKRFWYIYPSSPASPNVNITFSYIVSGEAPDNGDDSSVAQRYESGWRSGLSGGSGGTVTVSGITDLNGYVWALCRSDSQLPILLKKINYECKTDKLIIKWVTAVEINNSHFTIEKSFDNVVWNEIATIKGAGNSNNDLFYQYVDHNNSFTGTTFYRIKQTDYNGMCFYSDVLVTNCTSSNFDENKFFYSIENGKLFLSFVTDDTQKYMINLYDRIGKQVYSTELYTQTANQIYNFSIDNLSKGFYFISISSSFNSIIKKLLIY